jgi:hypothetical protein
VAGPYCMMLRRVRLRTADGYEVRCVYAVNNLVAVDDVAHSKSRRYRTERKSMKFRLPSLRTVVHDAHKNGAVVNRIRVSPDEAGRIRKAERQGGHQAGLVVVLQILREKQKRQGSWIVSYPERT